MILARTLAVLSVLLSLAGAVWYMWATTLRQDWPGVALGLAGALWMVTSGAGWIQIDRGLRRLRR